MSPEWDRFVTAVKLNKGLKETNHEQLYAYLKQHEKHATQDRLIIERITPTTNDQLAFVSTVQSYAQSSHNQNQNQRYLARGNGAAGNGGAQNRAGNANAGQDAADASLRKWCDECDAFNSDVDDEPTAQSIFMANLSSARPSNLQAGPSNASIISKVPILENAIDHINNISVVPSCASSALNDACVLSDNDANVPHDPIATELNIYKEQVAIYEQRAKFELTEHEQRMNDQMQLLKPHHVPVIVPSSEEDLDLAKITRIKMHEKMNDSASVEKRVKIIPPNYSKENFMATFTPQTQLTPEQVFWSLDLEKRKAKELKANAPPLPVLPPATVYPPNTPVHLVPRTLPTTSQVNIGLYVITQLFWDFEKTCKKRITPTGITEGERGFEQTKRCYLTEVIPFFNLLKEHFDGVQKSLVTEVRAMKAVFENLEAEVDQNAIDLKSSEIERKNLLIANENLIAECLSQDVFYTVTDSALTPSQFHELSIAYNVAKTRAVELEAENLNLHKKIQNDDHDNMVKHLSRLEVDNLNLQLKYQHLKDRTETSKSRTSMDAPEFNAFFELNEKNAQLQTHKNIILK
ncbi:hypothetical protein Tco_0559883 [Tanacetum coccineum]